MQRLLEHNHRLEDIKGYTIDQFIVFLDAAERADAVSRLAFTIDLTAAIGGALGGGDILKTHIDSLQSIAHGE